MNPTVSRMVRRSASPSAHLVAFIGLILLAPLGASCTLGWHHDSGARTLDPALAEPTVSGSAREAREQVDASRALSLVLPAGWSWFERGNDLIATHDGVFLQNLTIERIHVDQRDETIAGAFPIAALSSKQWPIRTVRHLGQRFSRGMAPLAAAEVLLESRRGDPLVTDLEVVDLSTQTVAGQDAFELVLNYRLKPAGPSDLELGFYGWSPFDVQGRTTAYHSVCYGFVIDAWFYGIECTSARRHYAEADGPAFASIVRSLRIVHR